MSTKSKDYRIYFAVVFAMIAGIILFNQKENFLGLYNQNFFWCLAFCLVGFSVLVLKLCINFVKPDSQAEKKKVILRYLIYYPIMLIVMSALSFAISTSIYNKSEKLFLLSSALLSFFLGFFIDSLPIIVEKLPGKLGGKD
jgi:hypothetical protein